MSKRNAYGRRKGKNQMRRAKREERNKTHLANCAKLGRKKRKEGMVEAKP